MRRFLELATVFLSCTWFAGCGSDAPSPSQTSAPSADGVNLANVFVEDLQGHQIPALSEVTGKAVVFLFVRTDCPISNRYAPEIKRLNETFKARGIRFWLVYPVASESASAIREHIAAYQLPIMAVRDPAHALAQRCGVTTTPQAAVFLAEDQTLAYSGRIDDRYVDFGVSRAAPTTHDLENALEAVLAGRTVPVATTPAVGCPIGKPL
jgi:hypothetical protein